MSQNIEDEPNADVDLYQNSLLIDRAELQRLRAAEKERGELAEALGWIERERNALRAIMVRVQRELSDNLNVRSMTLDAALSAGATEPPK